MQPVLKEDEHPAARWDGVMCMDEAMMEGAREEGGGERCLRVGGSEASKLLVKWKWLFSRIQDTWALCWINVSDLLSESLSERKRGRERGVVD